MPLLVYASCCKPLWYLLYCILHFLALPWTKRIRPGEGQLTFKDISRVCRHSKWLKRLKWLVPGGKRASPQTCCLSHSIIQSFNSIQSFNHSIIQSFYSIVQSFNHSIIQSFNHSIVHFNRSIIQFNHSIIQFNHPIIQSFNRSIIQSFNHSVIQSFNSIIQPFNHSVIRSFVLVSGFPSEIKDTGESPKLLAILSVIYRYV